MPNPGTSTLRHIAAILRHSAVDYAAYSDDLASNFGVVVDKVWRVCGAKIFCEHEFTLVTRA